MLIVINPMTFLKLKKIRNKNSWKIFKTSDNVEEYIGQVEVEKYQANITYSSELDLEFLKFLDTFNEYSTIRVNQTKSLETILYEAAILAKNTHKLLTEDATRETIERHRAERRRRTEALEDSSRPYVIASCDLYAPLYIRVELCLETAFAIIYKEAPIFSVRVFPLRITGDRENHKPIILERFNSLKQASKFFEGVGLDTSLREVLLP